MSRKLRKSAAPAPNGTGTTKKRVTFIIAPALDQGIELYCAGTGRLKNEVAALALAEFLKSREKELAKVLADATAAATTAANS